MYFLLTRDIGIVDVEQFETLEALTEQKLLGKNSDRIKKCSSAEEFMGQYSSGDCYGILIIKGDILPVTSRQHMTTIWSIVESDEEKTE